jgi:hypothetical protein
MARARLIHGIALIGLLAGAVAAPVAAVQLAITTCDTHLFDGDIGVLEADLDCAGAGVTLARHAKLKLNGHALSGTPGNTQAAIYCEGTCRVDGPGIVSGFVRGIRSDLTGKQRVTNVAFQGNAVGLGGNRLILTDVTANGNGIGLITDMLKARNVTVDGNDFTGIQGGKLLGRGLRVRNNGTYGIEVVRAKVRGLEATGNSRPGLVAEHALLLDSTLTGNDAGGSGVDLTTSNPPRLLNSVCGQSSNGSGGDWGVCTSD